MVVSCSLRACSWSERSVHAQPAAGSDKSDCAVVVLTFFVLSSCSLIDRSMHCGCVNMNYVLGCSTDRDGSLNSVVVFYD